jgi:hypothetical protein
VNNSKDILPTQNARKNNQGEQETQNKVVKVTETYNPTTKVVEDKNIEVTFTRTTNTQTTELQTGMDTYVATAEDITVERLTDEPGRVVIKNIPNHEFRALNGEIVLQDWTSGEEDTITFTFEETITSITIESRSTNASISFTAFEGFTYQVKSGETILFDNLKDNESGDLNDKLGVITVAGLTEGLPYDVHYSGYVVTETITQDEVEGQVDKLIVLYQYTFISFVPLTLNQRPTFSELELDYDGLAIYDKKDYFSSSTRQSFVVDNDSGLIYKIENINIDNISKGVLWLKDNFVPHDIRIKTNGDLEFYPLFTNTSIIAFDAFKDKHGNTFILNNRLNLTDVSSKVTFYVHNYKWNPHPNSQLRRVLENQNFTEVQRDITGFVKDTSYWLTDTNETLMLEFAPARLFNPPTNTTRIIKDLKLINKNHEKVNVPTTMNSNVYDFDIFYEPNHGGVKPYKIKNGWVYSESLSYNGWWQLVWDMEKNKNIWEKPKSYLSFGHFSAYNINDGSEFLFYSGIHTPTNNISYLKDRDIIIEYQDGKIGIIQNFSEYLRKLYYHFKNTNIYHFASYSNGPISRFPNNDDLLAAKLINENIFLDYELVLEDVGMENGEIIRFGVDGNTTYDLILEEVNGELTLVPYVKGTYVAPPPTTITFQPINR